MISRITILFFTFISIYIVFNRASYRSNTITLDNSGYYLYLPAIFIYNDLGQVNFYTKINKQYNLSGNRNFYGIFLQPNGKRVNKYGIGTCFFQLPFFLIAHFYCNVNKAYPADGYSLPYRLACILSTVFWVIAAFFFLRKFLLTYFNDRVAGFTILCIAFGTNLYTYTVFCQGMSHPYSFFLFAALLYYTDVWYRKFSMQSICLIGLILGFIIITRPINIVCAIIPLFWKVYNRQCLNARIKLFAGKMKEISIALILFLLVSFIQMSYWKYTSGHWIFYSYTGEGFYFLQPEIWKGLFSYQKGWFIYTPVAFISIAGFYSLFRYNKTFAPSLILFFIIMVYLVFCWGQWWYGSGFSCRPLIETLPVAAFPLASLINDLFSIPNKYLIKKAYITLLSFFIGLNIFQSYQFINSVIDGERMTGTSYWRVWGKLDTNSQEEYKYLMSDSELTQELNKNIK